MLTLRQRLNYIVRRGGNIDISGPWGTPLQMIWKILRRCRLPDYEIVLQLLIWMRCLKFSGANCDWVESDGTIVDEEDIIDVCAYRWEVLSKLGNGRDGYAWKNSEPKFELPGWYDWEALDDTESGKARRKARDIRDRLIFKLYFRKDEQLYTKM